jgi:hypothetical protein
MKRQYATFFLMPVLANRKPIEWGTASHPHTRQLQDQGVLKFIFANILLPDSNVNEPLSHGFVSFRIKPNLPQLPGDQITNIANISFDFNPPVITEPNVLVTEFSTGMNRIGTSELSFYPGPVIDHLNFQCSGDLRSIVILAADGREVLRLGSQAAATSIDVSRSDPGAYVLLAEMSNGNVARAHFIKQ